MPFDSLPSETEPNPTRILLIDTLALLNRRGGWCQGAEARNRRGDCVPYNDAAAVSFCILGAIRRVGNLSSFRASNLVFNLLGFSAIAFNDTPRRRRAEIIAVLRRAIELA